VDQDSGYRYYDLAQLETARLIAMLRQLDVPLADVKELLACDPADGAKRIAEHWRQAEATHAARRELATYLVTRLSGKGSVIMYEVASRQMPERSLLCLKRNVDEQGAWVTRACPTVTSPCRSPDHPATPSAGCRRDNTVTLRR